MQTFLPYPNFRRTAEVLDQKRLGKQRVENLQIMKALVTGRGWVNHPATKMWKGYEWALVEYQVAICEEWTRRGFKDACLERTIELAWLSGCDYPEDPELPPWLGEPLFHISHQSNLLRKDPDYYGPMFVGIPDDIPYVWPTKSKEKNMASDDLMIDNAKLIYRNFAGVAKEFNSEGDRNFCVLLPPDLAKALADDGWNIKYTRGSDDEPGDPYMQVKVNYSKGRPPRVVVITSTGKQDLGPDEVMMIDAADIKTADIVISPYHWGPIQGNSGVKAYLKTAWITIDENAFDLKYAHLSDPDPTSSIANEEVA